MATTSVPHNLLLSSSGARGPVDASRWKHAFRSTKPSRLAPRKQGSRLAFAKTTAAARGAFSSGVSRSMMIPSSWQHRRGWR